MKVKRISMLVALLLFIAIPATSFAETSNLKISAEVSNNNLRTEMVSIDNTLYRYTICSSPSSSNSLITVLNTSTGKADIVIIKDDTVYLNGRVIGAIKDDGIVSEDTVSKAARSSWVKIGKNHRRITWAEGTSAAVVAAIFAGAIGTPVAGVISFGVISVIAAQATGGTIYYTIYRRKVGKLINYKWVWSFRASTGDRYGPYTSYSTV